MLHTAISQGGAAAMPLPQVTTVKKLTAQPLTNEHREEALTFLSLRPLHTVYLAGLIHDNGIISPQHRGTFFACRNDEGQLEGIALIGHGTLIEAHSEAAFEAFGHLTQQCSNAHVIVGEQDKIERFWNHYSTGGQAPRLVCRELLLEQRWPVEVCEAVPGLRLATPDDLPLIVPAQAEMAFEESGINPLEKDPDGFRERVAQRIKRGRIYVWIENEQLIFKADVMAETPQVAYLEGIYVNSQERGQGHGLRCLTQLGRTLLARLESVILLVNTQNVQAHNLYLKAGYKLCGQYDTIFLQQSH